MSHIQKTQSGKYRVRWVDPATGLERSKSFALRRDADAFRVELDHAVQQATYVDPRRGRVSLAGYAREWLTTQSMGEAQFRITENAVRIHIEPTIGKLRLDQITQVHVQSWVDELARDLAPGTVTNILEVLKRIFRDSVSERIIARTPIPSKGEGRPVRVPHANDLVERWLMPDEVKRLSDSAPEDIATLIVFLSTTGLRIGEALGLQVGSIDVDRQQVVVTRQRKQSGGFSPTKNRRARTVPLPTSTLALLTPRVSSSGRATDLWTSDLGEPMKYRAFKYRWAKALESAALGWRPTPHDLRHYYASRLISEGIDIVRVSHYLGHATVTKTLNIYAHMMSPDHTDVSAIFDRHATE